jgi:RecA-family ATPase
MNAAQVATAPSPANDDLRVGTRKPYRLPLIRPQDWAALPIPQREWLVPGMIPDRTVTMLSGEGGTGKSLLALQLMVSMALRLDWLGKPVVPGPCVYFGAEDEVDELHRRVAGIVEHHGRTLDELQDVLLIPMADRDAVLAGPDKLGRMLQTQIFPALQYQARYLDAKLVVIDTSADVFAGNEIDRSQVRQFVSLLRSLAIYANCAVLLLSHPSLAGIATGTGLSGSTAWNNSVRSRLY